MAQSATKALDVDAMKQVFASRAGISDEQFRYSTERFERVRALELPGLSWRLSAQLSSDYPKVPLAVGVEALCAGLGVPFSGIFSSYVTMVERKLLPAWKLNRTMFHSPPPPSGRIGWCMVRLGLISSEQLQTILGMQSLIKEQSGIELRVGALVLRRLNTSLPDLLQSVCFRLDVPYHDFDQAVALVEKQESTSALSP